MFAERALQLPRLAKRLIVALTDCGLCTLTVWVALYLRLGEWVSLSTQGWLAVAISIAIALPVFVVFGLYRAVFRHVGQEALVAAVQACLVYSLLYAAVITAWGLPGIPRTVGIIQPILLLFAVAGSRSVARYWLGGLYRRALNRNSRRTNVLIYGAGSSGRNLASALAGHPTLNLVGFVDDDEGLRGSFMKGVRVSAPSELPELIERLDVAEILLAISSAPRVRRNEIVDSLRSLAVAVRTLPDITELATGHVSVSDIQPLAIEDLLGRDAVTPNELLLGRNILQKVVAVTGAGGSIGSELCRQILVVEPAKLLLIEQSEFALFSVHQELTRLSATRGIETEIIPLLGSAVNAPRMNEIFAAWRPNTVYHAAAYKHVPLVEHNIVEGITNNVFGTLATAQAARSAGVRDFVLISTDKAVRPTNVMGASKRMAEMILQALSAQGGETRFSMVRFGNVLGSSGSVVPLFREQIARGGPITITHPEIIRYFMTVPEAAQLVIQAGAMATGGEVFVLDMGEPVRIADLARKMIQLSGLTFRDEAHPDGDIEITYVGLRPGEKLYEELLIGNEPMPTRHSKIMMANEPCLSWRNLSPELDRMRAMLAAGDAVASRNLLGALVQDYRPAPEVVDYVVDRQPSPAAAE